MEVVAGVEVQYGADKHRRAFSRCAGDRVSHCGAVVAAVYIRDQWGQIKGGHGAILGGGQNARRQGRHIIGAGNDDGERRGVCAAVAIADFVGKDVACRLALRQGIRVWIGIVQGVGVDAVTADDDAAISPLHGNADIA